MTIEQAFPRLMSGEILTDHQGDQWRASSDGLTVQVRSDSLAEGVWFSANNLDRSSFSVEDD